MLTCSTPSLGPAPKAIENVNITPATAASAQPWPLPPTVAVVTTRLQRARKELSKASIRHIGDVALINTGALEQLSTFKPTFKTERYVPGNSPRLDVTMRLVRVVVVVWSW